MQRIITIQDVRDAFWDWQCWWFVAKSTGDVEDLTAMLRASGVYEEVCRDFLEQNPKMDYDERESYAYFCERYNRMIEEEDGEIEAER